MIRKDVKSNSYSKFTRRKMLHVEESTLHYLFCWHQLHVLRGIPPYLSYLLCMPVCKNKTVMLLIMKKIHRRHKWWLEIINSFSDSSNLSDTSKCVFEKLCKEPKRQLWCFSSYGIHRKLSNWTFIESTDSVFSFLKIHSIYNQCVNECKHHIF